MAWKAALSWISMRLTCSWGNFPGQCFWMNPCRSVLLQCSKTKQRLCVVCLKSTSSMMFLCLITFKASSSWWMRSKFFSGRFQRLICFTAQILLSETASNTVEQEPLPIGRRRMQGPTFRHFLIYFFYYIQLLSEPVIELSVAFAELSQERPSYGEKQNLNSQHFEYVNIQMSKLVQNYLLQEPIGKGVYGQVFRAVHQKSKLQYAVKVIPKTSFKANPKLEQLAINEINILSSLKNENIVRFVETLKTPNNFYFVYEYCNGGTLESHLQKKKLLKQDQALVIFRQLLEAFKELNKNNIMHRDLKPDNIFFSDGKIKLGDFGFCKMLEVNMAQTMLGSPIYMAPEILKEEIYTLKADIWSLGVVLFEMLFGYCPFESSSISQLINVIKETDLRIPQQLNPISQQCELLIQKMLVKDQFKRIEWVDLFDYKISEDGRIISGYKKDLGIEALEKYFLLDIKTDEMLDKKTQFREETQKPKFKEANVDSDKIIINKESNENKDFNDLIKKNSEQTAHSLEKQKDLQTQDNLYSNHSNKEGQNFFEKHNRWLRGVQLLDELSETGEAAETVFYYVVVVMLREINDQYHTHPEWTDVLLEEKRCLSDTLRALGREETACDIESGKKELLKLWLRTDQRWKMMWGRAIKYILGIEGSHTDIQVLLS